MSKPTQEQQALEVLAQATEPGVKLTRSDYVMVHQALGILNQLVNPEVKPEPSPEVAEVTQP